MPMMLRLLRGVARVVFLVVVLAAVGIGGFIGITLVHFGRDLPDTKQLAEYVPATGSKVYASDGSLMAEFESEHRIPVPISAVPKPMIQAVLAAEDRDFYSHKGVNPGAVFRAAMADILRFQRGQRPLGASTITQQVVRHFLLNNEVSVARKVKEALLAYRIENNLSKDRILEIYLNEIYLGAGAYGVAAAADTYFQKPLDKLSLAETALIAALPKAPNNYNPARREAAAKARRDWVLAGMAEIGAITQEQAKAAIAEPLGVHIRQTPEGGANGFFAEEVRRELIGRFGEKVVYEGGLSVRTSFAPNYQKMAETAFHNGLVEYDRRHGWRGALAHYGTGAEAQAALTGMADPAGIASWQLAAVTAIDYTGATLALKGGGTARLSLEAMRWARRTQQDQRLGPAVRQVRDVVTPGDIVLVEPVSTAPAQSYRSGGRHYAAAAAPTSYALRQIPDVSGGIVVEDPKTGRVFAMVGGWSFQQSQFNRATQAKRQPGSAFKPFVYLTALQNGFTPWSVVEDAPLSISQGPGQQPWQPVNYEGGYVGATTLEDALIHSRNLVTARLATMIGMPAIAKTVQDFDIMDKMPLYYSMSLGAGETTLLRLTNAYAMIDNGGHWLLPSVIDTVQDRDGKVVYQKGVKGCAACFVAAGASSDADTASLYKASGPADPSGIGVPNARYVENAVLYKPTKPDPMVNQEADADIIGMMQGVVERGTGTAVAALGKPIAGKTGTTSDWFDAWFVGFSPDLTAGVFIGFDDPRTLGDGEVGGHVAAPIFRDFMAEALKDKPAKPFPFAPRTQPVAVATVAPSDGTPVRSQSVASGFPTITTVDQMTAPLVDDQTASAEREDSNAKPRQGRRGTGDTAGPPGYPGPQWPNYAAPRASDEAATQVPSYPSPWGTAYAGTYGGTRAPSYAGAPPGYAGYTGYAGYGGYNVPQSPGYAQPGYAVPQARGYAPGSPPYGYYGPSAGTPRPGSGGLY